MTSATRAAIAATIVLATLGARARPGFAQTSADISLARQLGNDGLKRAASGDCAGAIEKLERAEGLHHAPTTLTVLGECHIAVGKLVDGVEELTRVVREDLGPKPLPAFRKAQARARQKLDDARPRLPKIRLAVEGARDDASIVIRIDGQTVPAATLGLDRPVDPGAHDIEVSASGYKTATAHITIKEGKSQPVKLALEAIPVAPPEPEVVAAPVPPPPERKATYLPAAISLGVGVAGIAVGAVLGVLTLNKASHLSSTCQPRNDCPASEQGDINSANTLALGSTIGFGVGALGAGLGAYFLLKPPKSDSGPAAVGVTVRPWVGPGSAGIAGSF
jgi:hypothetical protein